MEETKVTPNEVSDSIELDVEDFATPVQEETVEPTTEQQSEVKEIDYTPFLETISNKAKFNHEPVKVESLDDVITNFQKGLNYDKLKNELEELNNSEELTYIKTKAEEKGIDTKAFIKLVKEQEEKQKEAEYQNRYNELLDSGISEALVKEMVDKMRKADVLEKDMNKLKLESQRREQELEKNKVYDDFIKSYPDVDIEKLPSEVVTAKNIKTAYIEWQNKELQKQIEILKQNQDKANRNPVIGVSEHGGVEQESLDPFLKGFNS